MIERVLPPSIALRAVETLQHHYEAKSVMSDQQEKGDIGYFYDIRCNSTVYISIIRKICLNVKSGTQRRDTFRFLCFGYNNKIAHVVLQYQLFKRCAQNRGDMQRRKDMYT